MACTFSGMECNPCDSILYPKYVTDGTRCSPAPTSLCKTSSRIAKCLSLLLPDINILSRYTTTLGISFRRSSIIH